MHRSGRTGRWVLVALSLVLAGNVAAQNCGLSRIDHLVAHSDSGAWNPNVYRSLVGVLTVGQIGGALWEGAESRPGRTLWQGIDAELVAALAAGAGKLAFTRVRPSTEDNPCLWFQGGQNRSFPSGEAAVAAALVAPYVLEYAPDHPAVYALLTLPLYVGVARLKNQEHWQTDVLAGWAVGAASGWYAHDREVPITIQLLPHGVAVGLKRQF